MSLAGRETVASIKGFRGAPETQFAPRDGTMLRRVYDLFVDNPGINVNLREALPDLPGDRVGNSLVSLRDFYLLDIRVVGSAASHGRKGRTASIYCLVGRWNGPDYVDYLAARYPAGEDTP